MPTEKDYEKRKEDYDKRELSNIESYDRSILTLLTSTFGFSLLATGYLVANDQNICHTDYLIASWVLLSASIILYIANFWIAGRALDVDLERAEDCWERENRKVFNKRENWDICLKRINWIVGVLFIFALISMVSFLIKNLI